MTLTCTLECGSKKEVRVALSPPLSGYDQVTSRLIEMKAISQEGLGMVSSSCSFLKKSEAKVLTINYPDRGPENHHIQTRSAQR